MSGQGDGTPSRPKFGSVPALSLVPSHLSGVAMSGACEPHAESDRVALTRSAALDLDQAELFLLGLDTEMLTADAPRTAYLLGLAEGHLANLIQLVRAVTR